MLNQRSKTSKLIKYLILQILTLFLFVVPIFASAPPINQGTTGNKKLTANWTPNTYTVNFAANGVTTYLHQVRL